MLLLFFFLFFTFFSLLSVWIVSTVSPSCSLSFYSALSYKLLSSSAEFFISGITFSKFRIFIWLFWYSCHLYAEIPHMFINYVHLFLLILEYFHNGCFGGLGSISALLVVGHIYLFLCLSNTFFIVSWIL